MMNQLTIKPIYGLKDDCAIDSLTLTVPLDEEGRSWATYTPDAENIDYTQVKDAVSKSYGRSQWSNSANAQATKCLGLCELYDGTNTNHIYFDNGKCYIYDSSRDPVVKEDAGSTTFATDDTDLYSIITFGGYMIFSDRGEHTPYKWTNGDANLTKLILSGTEYKFRYLTHLANRIVGLYSDQTNGDLDVRYTDALPSWASLSFPAANQFYKPEGDYSITGVSKLRHDAGFIFSENDIHRVDYYSAATPVFKAVRVLHGWGSMNHHGIVSDGSFMYFLDKKRGFCKFNGNDEPEVISDIIEPTIGRMPVAYYDLACGKLISETDEVCWAVAMDSASTPNKLLFFNTITGQWRIEDKAARYIDCWRVFADGVTWTDLINMCDDTWPAAARWVYYISEREKIVWGDDDGQLYLHSGDRDNGGNWAAYRSEPVLPFPHHQNYKRVLEIWLDIAQTAGANLDIFWRGGDTAGEVEAGAWQPLGSIDMSGAGIPVLYVDQTARLHQIKYETDLKDEPFFINAINVKYVVEAKY